MNKVAMFASFHFFSFWFVATINRLDPILLPSNGNINWLLLGDIPGLTTAGHVLLNSSSDFASLCMFFHQVEFVQQLPKTITGKVKRNELRKKEWEQA